MPFIFYARTLIKTEVAAGGATHGDRLSPTFKVEGRCR
jgi:hypothetical protein